MVAYSVRFGAGSRALFFVVDWAVTVRFGAGSRVLGCLVGWVVSVRFGAGSRALGCLASWVISVLFGSNLVSVLHNAFDRYALFYVGAAIWSAVGGAAPAPGQQPGDCAGDGDGGFAPPIARAQHLMVHEPVTVFTIPLAAPP